MKAFAWMGLSATLFAFMGFFARIASVHGGVEHAHFTVVAAVRALVGAAVAFGVARARGVTPFVRPTKIMWLRSGFGTLAMGCTFYALASSSLPLADASTLSNLTPVFLALLAPIVLGERSGKRVAIALPLSTIGVLLIFRPPMLMAALTGQAPPHAATVPATVAILGAFFSACAMMSLRRASPGESPEVIAIHFSLTGAASLGLLALFFAKWPEIAELPSMLAAGVCAGFAQIAMTRAYALEHAARISGMGYWSVVVSAVLGATILGEKTSTIAIFGMALVVSGGIVLTVATMQEKKT